jgi:hypothetical protein
MVSLFYVSRKGRQERAAFQTVLKRRPHLLLYSPLIVQNIRQFVAVLDL